MFFVSISSVNPRYFFNLLVPNCSNALLISGWKIIIRANTPQLTTLSKIACNIVSLNTPLSHVTTNNKTIPFKTCHALESFVSLNILYAKNITIAISIKNNTKSIGCSHICIILAKILVS